MIFVFLLKISFSIDYFHIYEPICWYEMYIIAENKNHFIFRCWIGSRKIYQSFNVRIRELCCYCFFKFLELQFIPHCLISLCVFVSKKKLYNNIESSNATDLRILSDDRHKKKVIPCQNVMIILHQSDNIWIHLLKKKTSTKTEKQKRGETQDRIPNPIRQKKTHFILFSLDVSNEEITKIKIYKTSTRFPFNPDDYIQSDSWKNAFLKHRHIFLTFFK